MSESSLLFMQQEPAQNSRERILSQDYVSLIFHNETFPFRTEQILPEFLPQIVDWQYAIVNAPLAEYPPDISKQGYSTIPKLFTLLDTASLEASGILTVQNQPYLQLTGEGVVLGFIDTGIDYRHPAFRNPDGTTRILRIWDQNIQTGALPEGMLYGSEYTSEQINQALLLPNPEELVPSLDEIGHGTALAGIAAGSPDVTARFSGAAPKAELMVVKLKPAKQYLRDYFLVKEDAIVFQEDDCMLAIRYLRDTARKQRKPLVICFGLGTNQGGHDGHTPLEEVLTYMSFNSGTYGVTAAGNEGSMDHHFFGKASSMGDTREVEVVVEKETRGFTLELWAFAPELFSLGVTTPLGEKVTPADPRSGTSQNASFLLDRSTVRIDYEIVEFRSGSQLIQVRVANPSVGIWRFQVVNRRYLNGIFNIWLPITGIGSPDVHLLNPEPNITLTIPSCSLGAITTSTYQAFQDSIYLYSSRGFTRNEQLKPDLAAPGVNLQAPYLASSYRQFTGSSAAAAITAGAVALLVQWGLLGRVQKVLSTREIKNMLYRGADRIPELYYPNREWGYGALNVYGIFEALAEF